LLSAAGSGYPVEVLLSVEKGNIFLSMTLNFDL